MILMGRDFSFPWQLCSQWGEMVRFGMGHQFKALPFQPLNKQLKPLKHNYILTTDYHINKISEQGVVS